MKFLILGGNGYLGSQVVNGLGGGHKIVATRRENSDISRVKAEDILWIPAKTEAIKTAMLYESFDWILNMACNYGRSDVLYDDCIAANLQFPLEVLNLAAEFGIQNYLTIGTGLPDDFNMYTMSKKMLADFGRFYADRHNINFTAMKLEMFYGADEPTDRFIPSLILKCKKGEEIKVTLGTQHRDIVAIQDVVKAIFFVIDFKPEGYHEISVGTGEAPSIREMVEFVYRITNSNSRLSFGAVPMRQNEPSCVADTGKLAEMGFQCEIHWKDGLAEMVQKMKC